MVGRLVAALALLVSGLVLGSAAPAAACSCVYPDVRAIAAGADYAFSGVVTQERELDLVAIYRFRVDTVYRGDVRRTQDIVTARQPGNAASSCDLTLPEDEDLLVVGSVDDEGRLSLRACDRVGGHFWRTDPFADRVAAAFGVGVRPMPGRDVLAEAERPDWSRWSTGVVGVVGLAGLAVLARRRRGGSRRTPA